MPTPSAQRPDVTTIVVTHNNAAIVERCLAAVREATQRHVQEIILVDNASRDGTPQIAERAAPEIEIVLLSCNAGFAAANNAGRERARGRLLALVNSDCFPDKGAIDLLIDAADSRTTAGLFGGRLRYDDGRHQPSAGQLPTLASELWLALGLHLIAFTSRLGIGVLFSPRLYRRPRAVGWVSGAFCVARREIGPLPELAFMYGEDVAWAAQASDKGFHAWLEPRATAVHLGGASVERAAKAGFMEERSAEALIAWFAPQGRAETALIRAILSLRALLRMAGALVVLPLRRQSALAAIRRSWVMLRAANARGRDQSRLP